MKYNINVIESVWSDWFTPAAKQLKNRWMATVALLMFASLAYAGDANWALGSPDGGWSMGTPDASYPMDGDNAQIANDRTNREYQIAHHMIAVGFTSDEVLRAWGKPDEVTRSVSDIGVLESWRYKNPFASVQFKNGVVDSIYQ